MMNIDPFSINTEESGCQECEMESQTEKQRCACDDTLMYSQAGAVDKQELASKESPIVDTVPRYCEMSQMDKADASISVESMDSFISEISCDVSHIEHENPNKTKDAEGGEPMDLSSRMEGLAFFNALRKKALPKASCAFGHHPSIPPVSSSSASSRDSNIMPQFKQSKSSSSLNSLPSSPHSNNGKRFYSAANQVRSNLPPMLLGSIRTNSLSIARPTRLRQVSEGEKFPNYQSPSTSTFGSYRSSALVDNPPTQHRRTISNTSSIFSGSETSAFPIVGYLSDENSRIIQQHDSEENSAHQSSVDDRKKKSWAAKELKYFTKKFSVKRTSNTLNKNVELRRSKGYLM